ncbi:MAG: thioredoxin domain-containing protein [Chitinophagaceae bacterium]
MTPRHSNQLINETSPYLLQHAHNPVNWYPWSEEALTRAKEENKPILVSIGYSACHWCHVMERESFEDEATARIMNEHFINIKIDREERPDLDHIYMDAVQAMTGSGGWPLNVFLTPNAKPFYGGTYFPPQRAFNRPSWQETLLGVKQAFEERRHEIDAQAETLTDHLLKSNSFGLQKTGVDELFTIEKTGEIVKNLLQSADKEWGGFGKAPKFPQTFSIQYLLRYSLMKRLSEGKGGSVSFDTSQISVKPNDAEIPPSGGGGAALSQALLSLDKMIEGGIYDQVGGGFARYATDTEWLAPHFEKMLYDNALLIIVLCEAFQLTRKNRYKEVIHETMDFIRRELLHPEKGFYAALDADSEGVEGKFYVWSFPEVKELLGKHADVFCQFYDITEKGNWEGSNITRVRKSAEKVAAENGMTVDELTRILAEGKKKLLEERSRRTRPLLDDKILLGWNALMNIASSKAFAATGKEEYRQLAVTNMNFLAGSFKTGRVNEWHHTWKNGVARYPAFLDDYAFLIQAMLQLQEITGDTKWLLEASSLTGFVIENFSEEETGFFFYTPVNQADVIVRKKEVYDGAVPSGNSVMAYNLYHLSILLDKSAWKQRSLDMIAALGNAVVKYPGSFGNWACLLQEMITGTNEIALIGDDLSALFPEILSKYIPQRVFMASQKPDPAFPLLVNKPVAGIPAIYLCRNYTCQAPVFSANDLITLINRPQNT